MSIRLRFNFANHLWHAFAITSLERYVFLLQVGIAHLITVSNEVLACNDVSHWPTNDTKTICLYYHQPDIYKGLSVTCWLVVWLIYSLNDGVSYQIYYLKKWKAGHHQYLYKYVYNTGIFFPDQNVVPIVKIINISSVVWQLNRSVIEWENQRVSHEYTLYI